jgi:hypothetical protein
MIILADDLKRWPAASGYIEVRFIHRLQDQYPRSLGNVRSGNPPQPEQAPLARDRDRSSHAAQQNEGGNEGHS